MLSVAALYHFASVSDPAAARASLLELCETHGIKGTLLLADEGINGTIAGERDALDTVLTHIRQWPGFATLHAKYSHAAEMPFGRMKVRLKREIVTMGVPGIDASDAGSHVAPADWNALIADPDIVLIDTRNDFEVAMGSFPGAINPHTDSFRQFPDWFRDFAGQWESTADKPKIAMFCTGGIRCEKATAFVKAQGFDDVFHLDGGILQYLEDVPADESRWQGGCFVFDERVALGQGLAVVGTDDEESMASE